MATEQKTIEKITKELLENIGLEGTVSVSVSDDGPFLVDISGEDLGILIGYHGETINSFQLILSMMVHKKLDKWVKILVDTGNYRKDRESRLKEVAEKAAQKARFLQKAVELKPMSSYERMIVHSTISSLEGVKSESVGEGKERYVVVSPV